MNSKHRAPILTEEIRLLLDQHKKFEVEIADENKQCRPDQALITTCKKRKLRLKEEMHALLREMSPSQFVPVNPSLFIMPDQELKKELQARVRAHRRRSEIVGSGSFQLVALAAAVKEVQYEIDRRELEILFPAEPHMETLSQVEA